MAGYLFDLNEIPNEEGEESVSAAVQDSQSNSLPNIPLFDLNASPDEDHIIASRMHDIEMTEAQIPSTSQPSKRPGLEEKSQKSSLQENARIKNQPQTGSGSSEGGQKDGREFAKDTRASIDKHEKDLKQVRGLDELNDREEGECSDKEDIMDSSVRSDVGAGSSSGEQRHGASAEPIQVEKTEEEVACSRSSCGANDALDGSKEKNDSSNNLSSDSNKKMEVTNTVVSGNLAGGLKAKHSSVDTKSSGKERNNEDDSIKVIQSDYLNEKKEMRQPNWQTDGGKSSGLGVSGKFKKGLVESKYISCLGNKRKVDEQTEAKLGKKRSRQTMFLNMEDAKRVVSTPKGSSRRQLPIQMPNSLGKESQKLPPVLADGVIEKHNKEQRAADVDSSEGASIERVGQTVEDSGLTHASNPDKFMRGNSNLLSKRLNNASESVSENFSSSMSRQSSLKQGIEAKQGKSQVVNKPVLYSGQGRESTEQRPGKKQLLPPKKHGVNNGLYLDTSVERLHREVTSEKFWYHPDETELQRVPDRFESAEEYVQVFEPLLFEECRAQLYSAYEEFSETNSRDACAMVRVMSVERRERGWYDVTVIPANECKLQFKEGDMAVLSTSKQGAGRLKKVVPGNGSDEAKGENSSRLAGTVRKYYPIDTRDPDGAIVHFYIGDLYDQNSKSNDTQIITKLQRKNITWFLTALGSLATTQREYVALHAFRRLNPQMQRAILNPSPEQFPKYKESQPATPECFTSSFVDHLHKHFNGPQLEAIQWAAMHTAAGTNGNVSSKRQEPWPFTLVQGPPGTGKTHTVWGMLNVIHLVQYQHYYTSLLKKLAPESYGQGCDNNSGGGGGVASGSIDDVLQSMDRNLLYIIPKNCPKPRMLVCAPSNAATDELLQRVLDRGFIDGEMKVYRPDVARVGVDTQNRAAQAVSVERRADYLLGKNRDEVIGHLQHLQGRRILLFQQISALRRDLSLAAAAGRAQGTVGVDPEVLTARDHNRDTLLQNLAAVVEEHDKVQVEISRLEVLAGRFTAGVKFNMEEARSRLEASYANEAEIVFTTVSSSGRKLFQHLSHGFDMVVIDEAAQASEVGVLPPLSLGAARCVLVGDPQQLPATVISQAAGTLQYSRSLFERFQLAGCPTMLLSVQYRMHPQIRDFPSRYFYQNRLSDSDSVIKRPEEIYHRDPLLKPYIFYDITHGRESHRGSSVSYQNIHEAQFALKLYEHLQNIAKAAGLKVTVGIITPYKLQLKCLQREFETVLNTEEGKSMYINTVDAFQGQERDVIIMSCVRASGHGVGFVADIRRMNVALTRARKSLWVLGNAAALKQSPDWLALIEDARTRSCYMDMDSLPREFLSQMPPSLSSYQSRVPSGVRPQRLSTSNMRQPEAFIESSFPRHVDDNAPYSMRNGIHKSSRVRTDYSFSESASSSERQRDGWYEPVPKPERAVLDDSKRNDGTL